MKKCKTQVRRLTSFQREQPLFTMHSLVAQRQSSKLAESVDELKEEIMEVYPNEFEAVFVLSDENSGDPRLR